MKSVIHSFRYTLGYLREQVEGVSDREMTLQPDGARNHPLWTIGHITFACEMLGTVIGVDEFLPACWGGKFGFGSSPSQDPSLNVSKEEALEMLAEAENRLTSAVRDLDDDALDRPFPDEAFLDVFPTIRHALTQVLVGHTAYHVGQVGVWRSAMGLPPMRRSYE